jgi:hypothetical protein
MAHIVRGLLLVLLGLVTVSSWCGGKRQLWFSVNCAVARGGGVPDVEVDFKIGKRDAAGSIISGTTQYRTSTTLVTGWTTPVIVQYDMTLNSRTQEYEEDLYVIASAYDEGTLYADTATFNPLPFLDDTQSVSLRIDFPYHR